MIFAVLCLIAQGGLAAEHRVEKLDEAAPADALGDEIASKLQATGARVVRGTSRTVCDLWLCKELATGGATPQGVQYSFSEGQLIGAIRFPREGADFRDQDIPAGVYTLRYALQPVDGAHVGTFPTRDFLVLNKAESDQTAGPVETKTLIERGTEASETSHPAMMALLKVEGKAEAYPGIVHNEERDWWILRLEAPTKMGDKAAPLPLDIVVAGYVEE